MSHRTSAVNHRRTFLLKLTPIVALLAASGMLHAEEISYTGDGSMLNMGVPLGGGFTRDYVFSPSTLSGNIVWIDFASETNPPGGTDRYFYGGFTDDTRTVSGNTLRIVRTPTAGGGMNLEFFGGYSHAGDANHNRVFVMSDVSGGIYGGLSEDGNAIGNEVFVYGGTITGDIYGGNSYGGGAGAGRAIGNKVFLYGGVIYGEVVGGTGGPGAINNVVTLDGAHVLGGIVGGSHSDRAEGNVVNLNSGQVDNGVQGGNYYNAISFNNTININGNVIYGPNCWLLGGTTNPDGSIPGTGNTLNVRVRSANPNMISTFEYINFHLPPETRANDVVLDVTEAYISDGIIGVRLNPSSGLRIGDEVHLIRAETGLMYGTIASYDAQSTSPFLKYEFEVTQSSDGSYDYLNLKLLREYSDPTAKSLSEGRLASTTWLQAGADLALVQMTPNALHGRNVFGTVSAGKLRFNTGSHIDVEGYNLISGFSGLRRMDAGELSGGAFFEYGQGDYDSTNNFPSGRIKGSGRTEYTGLGALIRFDTTNGTYFDAILRGGRTETDYRSDDLRDASGRRVAYDIDGAYYGLHLGIGKRIALNAASSLDLSTRLLWTHQNGANATLSTGERVEFESINSTRLRLGARYTHTLSERLAAYAGVGVDHEFDSRARATLNDLKVDTPDMRGTTGQAELGLRFSSGENGPLTMETGIQGYAGKREGVTANFRLHYTF